MSEPARISEPVAAETLFPGVMRLARESMEHRKKIEKWIKTLPKFSLCPAHPSEKRPVDLEGSTRESWKQKKNVLVYAPCQQCAADEWRVNQNGRLLKMGVPHKLIHATLDNFRRENTTEAQALRCATKLVKDRNFFLVLLGPVGVGKSHLLASILRACGRGRMVTQFELLQMLRATYRDEHAEDIVEHCKKTPMLCLDELGLSSGGRDEFPMLHSILDHRYDRDLPTAMAGNLTLDQLSSLLGERMVDRLMECAVIVTLVGESKRKANRKLA